jgi:predicted amidophosphoribosyltransferase
MTLPECAICGAKFSLGEDGVCSVCLKRHDSAKQKKEDDDMLLRFAMAYEPKGAAYVKDAYAWATEMLAEYKKRTGK